MKTNKFFTAIFSMVLCINLVSCGNDDDNVIDSNNATKRVVSYTKIDERYNSIKSAYTISYDDNGKVSKIVDYHGDAYGDSDKYDFSFSGNEAVATAESKFEEFTDIDNIKFSLNENGYFTSAIWTFIEKSDTFYEESTYNYEFTYNSDNQVIKTKYNDDVEEDVEEYVYKNGVMVSSGVAEIITYTDIPNIGNLFVAFTSDYRTTLDMWRFAGLLGKASKFLPKTASWDEGTETYDYELDKEGYVKTVKVTFHDARDGKEWPYTYKYAYENIK